MQFESKQKQRSVHHLQLVFICVEFEKTLPLYRPVKFNLPFVFLFILLLEFVDGQGVVQFGRVLKTFIALLGHRFLDIWRIEQHLIISDLFLEFISVIIQTIHLS